MVLTTTHLRCVISLKYLPPIPISVFLKFLLGYNCFTVFCQFLLYSRVSRLYVYSLFFRFLFHLGHHRALSSFLAIQQVLIFFYMQQCIYVSPNLQIHPPHTVIHQFVLCLICLILWTYLASCLQDILFEITLVIPHYQVFSYAFFHIEIALLASPPTH